MNIVMSHTKVIMPSILTLPDILINLQKFPKRQSRKRSGCSNKSK
jgi:hypothetical protein